MIPLLNGRHFAASPVSLVSVLDSATISTSSLSESYGVTEEDAARACVEKVEQFLQTRGAVQTTFSGTPGIGHLCMKSI